MVELVFDPNALKFCSINPLRPVAFSVVTTVGPLLRVESIQNASAKLSFRGAYSETLDGEDPMA
jgi:hypothetical protein